MYGNPYYPMQQQMQLIRVNGMEGVRSTKLPPSSTAAEFDVNSDTMYIVSTDNAGFIAKIRKFHFEEQTEEDNDTFRTTITEQFKTIQSQIEELKEALNNGKQSVRTKSGKPESAE